MVNIGEEKKSVSDGVNIIFFENTNTSRTQPDSDTNLQHSQQGEKDPEKHCAFPVQIRNICCICMPGTPSPMLTMPGLCTSKRKVLGKQYMRMEVSVGLVGEACQVAC